MESRNVDLAYELQRELNWDKNFASSACKEYIRWLQIRANAADFLSCKLPPSRVVSVVWNLHRQWTMDYEKTCTALGGYIHHYPPAMRMSFSREQAYAATLNAYNSQFNEDPPVSFWEQAICPFRPNLGQSDLLSQVKGKTTGKKPPLISSMAQQSIRRREDDVGKQLEGNVEKNSGRVSRLRRRSATKPRYNETSFDTSEDDEVKEDVEDIPSERTVLDIVAEPLSYDQDVVADPALSATGKRHKMRFKSSKDDSVTNVDATLSKKPPPVPGRKVHDGYILKPLAPGQKRRRGRPSMSEYVPVRNLAKSHEGKGAPVAIPKKKGGARRSIVASSKSRLDDDPVSFSGKRKSSSWLKSTKVALTPRVGSKTRSDYSRSSRKHQESTERMRDEVDKGDSNSARPADPVVTTTQKVLPVTVLGPDGNPIRRPRGRPRKDGSWPVPRAKRQQTSTPTPKPRLPLMQPSTSQEEGPDANPREEPLSTSIIPNRGLEQLDVPMPGTETTVRPQIILTNGPRSNESPGLGA